MPNDERDYRLNRDLMADAPKRAAAFGHVMGLDDVAKQQAEQRAYAYGAENKAQDMGGCSRISCSELLYSRAAEYRRKAEALDRLAAALPAGLARLDPIADNVLFEMILAVRAY